MSVAIFAADATEACHFRWGALSVTGKNDQTTSRFAPSTQSRFSNSRSSTNLVEVFSMNLFKLIGASVALLASAPRIEAHAITAHDCNVLRQSGSLVDVIIRDEGPRSTPPASFDPAVHVRITYPVDYLAQPNNADQSGAEQSGENFAMKLDGTAYPWRERLTSKDNLINGSAPDAFRFLLHDRYSVEKVIAVRIRTMVGLPWSFDIPPLELSPLAIDGLLEVKNQKKPRYADMRLFVTKITSHFSDAIECNMRDDLHSKQCLHYFAYRNIDVTASYSHTLLPNWQTIRSHINSFLDCTYVEEIPNKTEGGLIWD
jgi:hypothetical protein